MSKSLRPSPSYSLSFSLEALEDRIAPATLIIGGSNVSSHNYSDTTLFTEGNIAAASANANTHAIGQFLDGAADVYYMTLKTGDKVFMNGSTTSFIEITAGTALAFFHDNGDHLVQANELTGLSIGGASKFIVHGDVNGAIVGNLDAKGVFGAASDGGTLILNSATSIASGLVTGHVETVATGGKIANLTISQSATTIVTGNGYTHTTGRDQVDLGGNNTTGPGSAAISFTTVSKVAGASISKLTVGRVEYIGAGDGGLSAAGGSISAVTIGSDDGGVTIRGGDAGSSPTNGGDGGSVSSITYSSQPGSDGMILINGGNGGFSVSKGVGGDGGSVSGVHIDALYAADTKSWVASATVEGADRLIAIVGGSGGRGTTLSGTGGLVTGAEVFSDGGSIILGGGQGGAIFNLGTAAGIGGAVSDSTAVSLSHHHEGIVQIHGGYAGTVFGSTTANGGDGGSVIDVLAAATTVKVTGGDGASGATGGDGGFVSGVGTNFGDIAIKDLTIQAGNGGVGNTGGAGAFVAEVDVLSGYQHSLDPYSFTGTTYTGASFKTAGVITNAAENILLDGSMKAFANDVSVNSPVSGNLVLTGTFNGGLNVNADVMGRVIIDENAVIHGGLKVNEAGEGIFVRHSDGSFTAYSAEASPGIVEGTVSVPVTSNDTAPTAAQVFAVTVSAGDGGDGITKVGGAGGSIAVASITSDGSNYSLDQSPDWTFHGGKGGSGHTGGGAGGSVGLLNLYAGANDPYSLGNVKVYAGAGGAGGDVGTHVIGSGGKGGDIQGIDAELYISSVTSFSVTAGNGGDASVAGAVGGAGGSILKAINVNQLLDYGSDIHVAAGDGGNSNTAVGAGGSINALRVDTSYEANVGVQAGSAGTGLVSGKAAVGGTVKDFQIGANDAAHITVNAGNGSSGGVGGAIDGVTDVGFHSTYADTDPVTHKAVYHIQPETFGLQLAAGSGSAGATASGAGGSVKNVNLLASSQDFLFVGGMAGGGAKPAAGGSVESIKITNSATAQAYNYTTQMYKAVTAVFPSDVDLGSVTLIGGAGGDSSGATAGGNGGYIKTVSFNIDGLVRYIAAGYGGSSVSGPAGHRGTVTAITGSYTDPSLAT